MAMQGDCSTWLITQQRCRWTALAITIPAADVATGTKWLPNARRF
jgi:hypothetical protein